MKTKNIAEYTLWAILLKTKDVPRSKARVFQRVDEENRSKRQFSSYTPY